MLVYNGDFHFIEKAKGAKYLYASLDRHPHVCSMVPNIRQFCIPSH
jgi:hypothetical protein